VKVFFDTNVYVAEALLGEMAERLIEATERAGWRTFASVYLLDELERVLTVKLGFSRRLALLSRGRIVRHSKLIEPGFPLMWCRATRPITPSFKPLSPQVRTTS
jgi:predicted nucleic acid-binding protein